MNYIYEKLNFPDDSFMNKELEISRFLKASGIDENDKKIFESKVNKITLKYLLNTYNTNYKKSIRDGYEFGELLLLEIIINDKKSVYDIQKVIGKAISYPTILIIKLNDKIKIGTYKNRDSKINGINNIISDVIFTGWFKLNNAESRLNDVLSEINFNNFYKLNNFREIFNAYYKIISKYSSKYIPIQDAARFMKSEGLYYDINKFREYVIKNFEYLNVNPNNNTVIKRFATSKMEKYTDSKSLNLTMLCLDELYVFLKKYGKRNIHSYEDFEYDLKNYYTSRSFYKSLERRKSDDCYYFDGYGNCIFKGNYFCECNNPSECSFFRRLK